MTLPLEFTGQPPLFPIHCRGCGQTMGWGSGQPLDRNVYCSPLCGLDGPLGDYEERNDLIRNVIAAGWTISDAAAAFGVSRQRITQVLAR